MQHPSLQTELPDLPLDAWLDTKRTLHLYTQIVGKIRLALHPKLNHWWHVPLYVSSRGLTTRAIPVPQSSGYLLLELEFDFITHALIIRTSTGQAERLRLQDGLRVSAFYTWVFTSLTKLGIHVPILAKPFDPDRVGSDVPFIDDTQHHHYDPVMSHHFWQILCWAHGALVTFKGRFHEKSSPVHFFWHSFDLAYTRFSGRRTPQADTADPVTREAYSHEVISFGFWPGDDNVPAPAFYSYTNPEPQGLSDMHLQPDQAFWKVTNGSAIALLMYDDVRQSNNPQENLLAFLESAYKAGASTANWNIN